MIKSGQYLDIEPHLRHAPLIISESGCNTNTEAVSTPRGKKNDDKSAVAMLKKNGWHENVRQLVVNLDKKSRKIVAT